MTLSALARPAISHSWTAVILAWIAGMAVLLTWLLGTSTGTLREQLKVLQFWWLEGIALLAFLVGVAVVSRLWRSLERRDIVRMVLLAAVAAGLTLFVAPRTNRIFYDEQIYQSVGQNLADLRRAQMCNDGGVEYGRLRCVNGEYNKQPYGYPHLLSLTYRLFGARPTTAFAVNAAAMAASVCTVYLLISMLFRDRDAALVGGLLLALTPQQLIWSATAAVEPTASLASLLAVLAAAYFLRAGSTLAILAVVVFTAHAVQFRPESMLTMPVVALVVWPRLRAELDRPRTWWAGLLLLALVSIHLAHLFAVRQMSWGASAARFSVDYVPANLQVNGWFYLYDERFPPTFTLLALIGATMATMRRERMAMVAYFGLYFAIDLIFYAGSYNYGADVRYSLMTYPPIAVLGGLGAGRVVSVLARPLLPVRALIVTALAFQFLWYAPLVRATTEEAWAARADVAFARSAAAALPPNSFVLTQNPGMFQLWGSNAGQMFRILSNPRYLTYLLDRYTGGVYVHWNFWCNVQEPIQPELCRKAMALRPVELIVEHHERDQRYAFYRLLKASP